MVPLRSSVVVDSSSEVPSAPRGPSSTLPHNLSHFLTVSKAIDDKFELGGKESYIKSEGLGSPMPAPSTKPTYVDSTKRDFYTLQWTIIGVGAAIAGTVLSLFFFVYQATTDVTREINEKTRSEGLAIRDEVRAGFQSLSDKIDVKLDSMETRLETKMNAALAVEESKREIQKLQIENNLLKERETRR